MLDNEKWRKKNIKYIRYSYFLLSYQGFLYNLLIHFLFEVNFFLTLFTNLLNKLKKKKKKKKTKFSYKKKKKKKISFIIPKKQIKTNHKHNIIIIFNQ